jgi:L-2,4-diaminobutyrate decarboxylase
MRQNADNYSSKATAAELVEKVCNDFLTARSKVLSPKIVDVAEHSDIATMRDLAFPQAQGQPLGRTIDDMLKIMKHRVAMESPSFFGFIPSPVHESSLMGSIITTMFNVHAGSWFQSAGPSAIEDTLIKWLTQQVGMPKSAGGVFVSGGSHANLTAIVAARDAKLEFEQRAKAVVYVSEQTHSSIQKGLNVAGFHVKQTRRVESDGQYSMRPSSLREAIIADREAGLVPFMIVATCGLTNTGGIDPLHELADVAKADGLWLHVDGAYGASIVLSKQNKTLADGLGRADSLSWDAHKWLFQTYGCGMVLVREARHLVQSFAVNASYIQDADEADAASVNFWNRGIELTRPVRAMKLWFTLHTLGLDEVGRMIDHGIKLAEAAQKTFEQLDSWRVVTAAKLAIVNFSHVVWTTDSQGERVEDTALSEHVNAEVSKRAIARNIAAPLTTRLGGRLNLRMCTISPLLSIEQLVDIVHALDSIAREISAELGHGYASKPV